MDVSDIMQKPACVVLVLTYFLLALSSSGKSDTPFSCSEQFGYYSDPKDCSKYYVCVFGDPLHESCTGGLYFSSELQTCDWPRNTKCGGGSQDNEEDHESLRQSDDIFLSQRRNPETSHEVSSSYGERTASNSRGAKSGRLEPLTPRDGRTWSSISNSTSSPLIHPPPNPPPVQIIPITTPHYNQYNRQEKSSNPEQNNYNTFSGDRSPNVFDLSVFVKQVFGNGDESKGTVTDVQTYDINNRRREPDVLAPIDHNNGRSKDPDEGPYPGLELNRKNSSPGRENFEGAKRYSAINTNNGNQNDPDSTLAYRNNRGNYQESDESSLYKDRDTSKGTATRSSYSNLGDIENLPVFNSNNGKHEDADVILPLSRNNGHFKDPDTITPLSRNNDQYKDPNVRLPTSALVTPLERSHKVNDQSTKNHRPTYGRPVQALEGSDSLDAQFGTNPAIISLPDPPNQRNYNYPSDKKLTTTRNLKNPHTDDKQAGNNPSEHFNYRNYNEPYQYSYEYYDDYDPTADTPPLKVKSHKSPTVQTTNFTKIPSVVTKPPASRPVQQVDSTPNFPSRPLPVYPTPTPLVAAGKCNPSTCLVPDCRCGGTDIPNGLPVRETPQVILLTFDDAINDLNFDLYKEIFTGRNNPNGCPILGTFYVSHEWTDYGQVQTLYSLGHEMASHTISHSYGEKFSKNKWFKEVQGQREVLHLYGGVKLEDIRGMRAPFLQIGGNPMFEMLFEANFTYDSSMPVFENNPPFWPFTLDYTINNECMITPCPSKSFPGLWEMGMVMWVDLRGGRCSMADACSSHQDEEGIVKFLNKNFNRHYKSNRAPLGLFYHSAWFTTAHHRKGFMKFLDDILSKGDVWVITNWQLIQWLRSPTPISKLNNFEPWQCKRKDLPPPCHHPTVCNVWDKNGIRYMKTCQKCPSHYPWVGKTGYKEGG
ncbi:uncharacterized protein LOC106460759 [Limulus polyphemus]|uniref:Uncharacterized protein LOC106460759 n=1 Tax=Limulus polyphemus TaxID=6850 RepID=A0ABM1SHZ0_LIMPO|nr:uncharacterized protein LOC106460759 [Limulus polyphemus]